MKQRHDFSRLVAAAACVLLTLASGSLAAQAPAPTEEGETLTFTFAPGNDLFTQQGNEAELARLFSRVDEYHSEITAGRMPIRVDGYCASLPAPADNLRTAYLRASRVKSELITQKRLTEDAFITGNYASAYLGIHKDVVVVTLRIPMKEEAIPAEEKPAPTEKKPAPTDVAAETPRQETPQVKEVVEVVEQPALTAEPRAETAVKETAVKQASAKPYLLALRTNLLYDALLLPALGIEWRINDRIGIRLDGSLSRWGGSTGKVQKAWLLNPEARWYLLHDKRFYAGISGSYGEYNIYKYPLGSLLKDDTGYQGHLWNAGLTVGYQLRLCRHLSVDFNLGLGYTRSEYDSFTVTGNTRVYKQRDRKKNLWGPTQAGISLVWTIGSEKQ